MNRTTIAPPPTATATRLNAPARASLSASDHPTVSLDATTDVGYDLSSYLVNEIMIEFHLETRSGVPTYLQLVQQVRQAVRLGILRPGDQLPTVKEVVERLTINPNTVLRAYRELDQQGLVEGRRGVGTFVASGQLPVPPNDVKTLRLSLQRWIDQARTAGLDDESMAALFADTIRPPISRVA